MIVTLMIIGVLAALYWREIYDTINYLILVHKARVKYKSWKRPRRPPSGGFVW